MRSEESGEDQQAGAKMLNASLLQMIGEEDVSEDAVEKLSSFLAAYLQKKNDADLVCVLQGSSQ